VYNAVVITSLLYCCETWTLYRRHIKKLEHFHMRALRSILKISWKDHVTNLDVLQRANSTSIESILIKAQLRWVGHVIRMEEHRMPRCLMYGELWQGRRYQGRPKLRYKDTEVQHSVVPCKAEGIGGKCCEQARVEGQNLQVRCKF